jgi:glycosyltransferase involved in cell wall biosynthesis
MVISDCDTKPLKILTLNDAHEGGGAELVFRKTADLLKMCGHEVELYSEKLYPKIEWRDLPNYIFSFRQYRKLKKLIQDQKPDIIHLHNFYHYLSPAILYYLQRWKKKMGYKIVMTVHDYHFLCANNGCIRWKNNLPKICEKCTGRKYYQILLNQCDPRGFVFNALKFLQHFIAYNLFHFERTIDSFIAPSEFLKKRLLSFCGEEKITVLNNPVFDFEKDKTGIYQYAKTIGIEFESIFIGRIEPAKGLEHFINEDYTPEKFGKFVIVGDGDPVYMEKLKQLVLEKALSQQIQFLGRKNHVETLAYLSKARVLIFSSLLYENCPLTVLEARLFNKEIFHYNLGSIQEMLALDKKSLSEKMYAKRLSNEYERLVKEA